ncbi:hypothetical protein [Corynebacterium sp. AOP40-4SA-5]|uniref:hypothetical protein n=1 Tax=Corynebacterium sp. AOP40-4SA-5 TaxID=3457678 RepID=UPI0040339B91
MSNVTRATLVINETYADEYVKMHMTPPKVAAALDDAGCLAPDLQIIRTPAELEALDPSTLLVDWEGDVHNAEDWLANGFALHDGHVLAIIPTEPLRQACEDELPEDDDQ